MSSAILAEILGNSLTKLSDIKKSVSKFEHSRDLDRSNIPWHELEGISSADPGDEEIQTVSASLIIEHCGQNAVRHQIGWYKAKNGEKIRRYIVLKMVKRTNKENKEEKLDMIRIWDGNLEHHPFNVLPEALQIEYVGE